MLADTKSMGSRLFLSIISDWIVSFDISQHNWVCLGQLSLSRMSNNVTLLPNL